MKSRADILNRLLRASRDHLAEKEMPFGFDTRVLALARRDRPNGAAAISLLVRRIAMVAGAIIVVAGVGAYQTTISNPELPIEYAIADRAIQTDLNE